MSQYARPNNDINIGNWTDQGGNTLNLWSRIDEVTASDSDNIKSETNPSNSSCEIGFSSVTDPQSSVNHVLNFRISGLGTGGGDGDITMELYNGSTLIASYNYTSVGGSGTYLDKSETLSASEADSISDYSNLSFKITATKTAGTAWGAKLSWIEFVVPDAASSGSSGNKYQMLI